MIISNSKVSVVPQNSVPIIFPQPLKLSLKKNNNKPSNPFLFHLYIFGFVFFDMSSSEANSCTGEIQPEASSTS